MNDFENLLADRILDTFITHVSYLLEKYPEEKNSAIFLEIYPEIINRSKESVTEALGLVVHLYDVMERNVRVKYKDKYIPYTDLALDNEKGYAPPSKKTYHPQFTLAVEAITDMVPGACYDPVDLMKHILEHPYVRKVILTKPPVPTGAAGIVKHYLQEKKAASSRDSE